MSIAKHQSAAMLKNEWLTPPSLIDRLGPFTLDPCAAPEPRPWPTAQRHITRRENGLLCAWHGFVWLNPPYGPQTVTWLARLAEHNHGIALIFARTETSWFFEQVWPKASALLFIQGRLTFHHSDGSPGNYTSGAPSVLVSYGGRGRQRLADNKDLGHLVYP